MSSNKLFNCTRIDKWTKNGAIVGPQLNLVTMNMEFFKLTFCGSVVDQVTTTNCMGNKCRRHRECSMHSWCIACHGEVNSIYNECDVGLAKVVQVTSLSFPKKVEDIEDYISKTVLLSKHTKPITDEECIGLETLMEDHGECCGYEFVEGYGCEFGEERKCTVCDTIEDDGYANNYSSPGIKLSKDSYKIFAERLRVAKARKDERTGQELIKLAQSTEQKMEDLRRKYQFS
jgi:hypothetical protein